MSNRQKRNNTDELSEVPLQARGAVYACSRSFQVVIFMLTAYVVSVALYHTIAESFPEVICQSPILSGYSHVCKPDHPRKPVVNPNCIAFSWLQSRLEYVLEDSVITLVGADSVKSSARELRDLSKHVKLSFRNDTLGRELEHFVECAKDAGESLQELSDWVWGATDQVVTLNDWIVVILELSSSGGFFSRVANLLIPFGQEIVSIREQRMGGLCLQAIKLLNRNLGGLIHRTEINVGLLKRLEERLNTIQDMTVVEEKALRSEEQEFRRQRSPDEKNSESRSAGFELLLKIRDRRKHALNQIVSIWSQFKHMSNELSDLRKSTATPIIPDSSNIPIEAYIKSIRSGTERLLYAQTRAREIEGAHRKKKFCSNYCTEL